MKKLSTNFCIYNVNFSIYIKANWLNDQILL